jgi:MFS family permease
MPSFSGSTHWVDLAPEIARRQRVRAIVAATIGTSIEWYDFFLYNTAAALIFPALFFPREDLLSGLLIGFTTQFVGFLARPVGAFIFGHFGDRIGRKATLIATLLLMGLSTAAIGLLPGYAITGMSAGLLLSTLRILQGIGVGGEWGGSVLLSMEWGSNERRGLNASWPQVGVPVGLILGNGVMLLFSALSGPGFLTWGWRVPFLLGLALVAVGLYIRLGILETPPFTRLLEQRRVATRPLVEAITRYPMEIVLSALVRTSEQAPFYLYTSFLLSYATGRLSYSRNFMLLSVMVAAGLSLFTVPISGYLSDRYGRKLLYAIGAVSSALFAFPYFLLLGSGMAALAMLAVIVSLFTHDLQYGPQASLIAESFTGRLRYSGASLGYHLASIVSGGPAPLIAAALLAASGTSTGVAVYLIVCSAVTLVALALLPNRQDMDHALEYDETMAPKTAGERSPAWWAPPGYPQVISGNSRSQPPE